MASLRTKKLLIVTNKDDFTADFVINRLRKKKLNYSRLNTESFPLSVNSSIRISSEELKINIQNDKWDLFLDTIDSIWYRRPVLSDVSPYLNEQSDIQFALRESWEYLQNLWLILRDKHWVNNPLMLRISEKKMYQLKIASQIGLNIPNTLVTNNPDEAKSFYLQYEKKLISKPISHGAYGENEEFAIFTTDIEKIECDFSSLISAPTIFQEKISKKADVRVSVFGNKIFAYYIFTDDSEIDWRKVPPNNQRTEPCILPPEIEVKIFTLMHKLNLSFAAIDFCLDNDGKWIFLEVNPNGQWAWFDIQNESFQMTDALIELLYD